MTYQYPSFESLDIAPDYLLIGAAAMDALRPPGKRKTVRSMADVERRAYNRTTRKSWAGRMKMRRVG